jgi:23S rRNA pseudouridine2605 synthase
MGSRTEARKWIAGGQVQVNGKTIRDPDHWIDLSRDRVFFNGRPLQTRDKSYVLLYKPKGYITTYRDPQGRPTVYDLIADLKTWMIPVGRLDLETSGLLLLTNDTQFAEAITNPERKVPKTYLVKASTLLTEEQLAALRAGVVLSDGPTRPALVNRIRDSEKYTFLEMTIVEGRNRQVRRMIEAIGSKVLKLVRTAIGPIRIDDLKIGDWRELTPHEVKSLEGEVVRDKALKRARAPLGPSGKRRG